MINDDEDVLGRGFLDPDSSRFMLDSSSSTAINRSLSMPLYASQMGVDANPWNTDPQFEPVSDINQDMATHTAVDDAILGEELTAASVLGKLFCLFTS